jgi:hypothetical protein
MSNKKLKKFKSNYKNKSKLKFNQEEKQVIRSRKAVAVK